MAAVGALVAALSYATARSDLACCATAPPAWLSPPSVSEARPVIETVGNDPRSPVSTVAPVFVTPDPASTANEALAASGTAGTCTGGTTGVTGGTVTTGVVTAG